MESTKIRLCEPCTVLCDEWKRLYEGAFPLGEREPAEKLSRMIGEGRMLYHRTLDEQGNLLCFTMVTLASDFSFLAYMATDPERRSGGIGSKHLKRLVELLKEQYPSHHGLFLEIEAPDPATIVITEEERTIRQRRLSFYQRFGARIVCEQAVYLTPSFSQPGKEWEGDLLAIEFGPPVCKHTVAHVIREIYSRFYQLPPQHSLVQKVLSNFEQCDGTDHGDAARPCGGPLRVLGHRIRSWWYRLWDSLVRRLRS
jgi:GNAT superfamily N-acetyltransferase